MAVRGFEIISKYKDDMINLPRRRTAFSAGYDIEAAEDVEIQPQQVVLIPTGLKAYMPDNEFLGLFIRSSIAIKYKLSLINGQGIIDADYYNNESNEGHIMVAVINYGNETIKINKGTRIAQGIFYKYYCVDDDDSCIGTTRTGGFGSTGD